MFFRRGTLLPFRLLLLPRTMAWAAEEEEEEERPER